MKNSTISLVSYINPLYESYLNEIQKALINSYCEWSNKKNLSWKCICELLSDFSLVCGVSKKEGIRCLYDKGWANSEKDIVHFYDILEQYTRDIRNSLSFDLYIENLCPSTIEPPKDIPEYFLKTPIIFHSINPQHFIVKVINNQAYLIYSNDKELIIFQINNETVKHLCKQLTKISNIVN